MYVQYKTTTAPITLHKDALDYGVGGCLFQTVDGIVQSVVFVSKSLNKFQLRWSVIQKEAYGIFHSCMYLQPLLRDRLFKIRTDHRNLLFIKEASDPMIVRWYMALSEFSFTLEFRRVLFRSDTYSRQWMALTNLLLSRVSHLTSSNYVGQ